MFHELVKEWGNVCTTLSIAYSGPEVKADCDIFGRKCLLDAFMFRTIVNISRGWKT